MTTYYLLTDPIVPIYIGHDATMGIAPQLPHVEKLAFYSERGMTLPKAYTVANLGGGTQIRVVFFDVETGHFLIKAPNQETAYRAARALEGFFYLAVGHAPQLDRSLPKLLEITRIPKATWTRERLTEELSQRNLILDPVQITDLYTGRYVQQMEMRQLGPRVEAIYADHRLADSLAHLGHSRFLFYGFMVGSYYHCHYKHDRQTLTPHMMQKNFLENRERYELAFISAFKGIERFLNLSQVKHDNIERSLIRLNMPDVKPDTVYQRYHEIFSKHPKRVKYKELIAHFLDIRNAAAAHANPSPPEQFLISEDTLMEIQLFLSELCGKAIGSIEPRPLPHAAIVPLSSQASDA